MMLATPTIVLCSSCGNRLARDHADTICSPCRRTMIESSAHREGVIAHDQSGIKAAFTQDGLYGVSEHLHSTPAEALDVAISCRLIPFMSPRRRAMLRQLVTMGDCSHIAVAEALNISRWTVATYRRQLGIERVPASMHGGRQ